MRLIDADALEYHEIDEIGGEYNPYLGCSKEYIDRQPTIAVLDNIRAEIEQRKGKEYLCFDDDDMDIYITGLNDAIDIIDKYKAERRK